MKALTAVCFGLRIRYEREGECRIFWDREAKTLNFDRSASFPSGETSGAEIRSCPVDFSDFSGETLKLRLFSDTSSLELFTDGGRTALSFSVYPGAQKHTVSFFCAPPGSALLNKAVLWDLKV